MPCRMGLPDCRSRSYPVHRNQTVGNGQWLRPLVLFDDAAGPLVPSCVDGEQIWEGGGGDVASAHGSGHSVARVMKSVASASSGRPRRNMLLRLASAVDSAGLGLGTETQRCLMPPSACRFRYGGESADPWSVLFGIACLASVGPSVGDIPSTVLVGPEVGGHDLLKAPITGGGEHCLG